ncbi:hypothetical protein EPA93_38415 [Ktedonosporobacter rubrisoli]|uniref:Uncharacterized protein n=1 Tax=Ktedonosporobacter rubrisoli TaxID=2509675 RepID=A0A4P6K138_KTERU|nr:hypothetical protein [Ktedonosporobacter rubrisoli]QBD81532.1 hypothetical protein EPA93_38415 [Ktedonosporobacter rubrisoli]
MAVPTLDQTEGVWITRTDDHGFHFVQEVFSEETSSGRFHRSNCSRLIARGSLEPEAEDRLAPEQRVWNRMQRYRRVHA